MSKEKTYSKNDLVEFYYKCPLFKKYCQYNLWFGSFNEYDSIKYCKRYTYQYFNTSIKNFVLQHFSLSILFVLYASPCFIKFVESGFFKYLDFHFLLLFHNNYFNCSLKDKKNIENFVHKYFKKYLKNRLKQDLILCISKSINELPSNSFRLLLVNRTKYLRINVKKFSSKQKVFLKSNEYKQEKAVFFTNLLLKKLFCGISLFNKKQICVKSINYQRLFNNAISPTFFLIHIVFKLQLEKTYVNYINKNIQNLAERLETLSVFYIRSKNVGLYKKFDTLFDNSFYYKPFKPNKSFIQFKRLVKSFNFCLNTNKYKI